MLIKSKPKLAFFDIDGTLVGRSGIISERTRSALVALRNKGVQIALATGRPIFGARKIAQFLEVDCFCLFSSGALLANPKNDKLLFEAVITPNSINTCLREATKLGLYVELYSRHSYFIEKQTPITVKHCEYLEVDPQIVDLEQIILTEAINKIVTISDNSDLESKQNILIDKLAGLICLCSKGASHPEIMFNNITSPAADRREGFFCILNELGIDPEQTLAFGDAQADLAFIELAGLGVAMKGSPQEVLERADLIAESADEDGLAVVVEQIVASI